MRWNTPFQTVTATNKTLLFANIVNWNDLQIENIRYRKMLYECQSDISQFDSYVCKVTCFDQLQCIQNTDLSLTLWFCNFFFLKYVLVLTSDLDMFLIVSAMFFNVFVLSSIARGKCRGLRYYKTWLTSLHLGTWPKSGASGICWSCKFYLILIHLFISEFSVLNLYIFLFRNLLNAASRFVTFCCFKDQLVDFDSLGFHCQLYDSVTQLTYSMNTNEFIKCKRNDLFIRKHYTWLTYFCQNFIFWFTFSKDNQMLHLLRKVIHIECNFTFDATKFIYFDFTHWINNHINQIQMK